MYRKHRGFKTNDDGSVSIPLTYGFSCVVDAIDVDLADLTWSARGRARPYARHRKWHHKDTFIHRIILERKLGRPLTPGEIVDHVDGDVLNNRRSNLRLATHTDNMRNRKLQVNNKSGYTGVRIRRSRWVAEIRVNGKKIHLGYFDNAEDAYKAYQNAASKYFGEFARR